MERRANAITRDEQIILREVSVSYAEDSSSSRHIFDGFSLTIERGEFVWLAGRNGVGKTTLLRVLAGLLRPSTGEVSIFGEPPERARVALVFQDPSASLLPWFTARRNIELPLVWAGRAKEEREMAVDRLIEQLQIRFDLEAPPYQLSGGQQQLVSIARGLSIEPTLMLLDEPLTYLDIDHRLLLLETLRNIWSEMGITCVLAGHELNSSLDLATRCLVLDGSPAHIIGEVDLGKPDAVGRDDARKAAASAVAKYFRGRDVHQ